MIRSGKAISTFDLYDLLLKGDKSADRPITSEDVIYVGSVGGQVAIFGAVNKAAIYELRSKESFVELLTFAGGFASDAANTFISYMGLVTRCDGFHEIKSTQFNSQTLLDGDFFFATNIDGKISDKKRNFYKVNIMLKLNSSLNLWFICGSYDVSSLLLAGLKKLNSIKIIA